jgi:rubrerythrin
MVLFCPNCVNILDVSKNPPTSNTISSNQQLNAITPTSVSEDDVVGDKPTFVDEIVNKLINNEDVTNSMISTVRLDQIIKSLTYQQLNKKQKSMIQNKYAELLDKISESVNAYYFCKNCMYSEPINSGALVISRIGSETSANYVNLERFKNKRYSHILPFTRNYICINDACETNHTDPKKRKVKEAVFYRVGTSMQVSYTCTVCGNYWNGS